MNYYALTDERIEEIVLSAFNDAGTIMNELGIEFTNNHEVNNIGIKQINGETEEINSEPEISSEIQEYIPPCLLPDINRVDILFKEIQEIDNNLNLKDYSQEVYQKTNQYFENSPYL